MEIIVAKEGGFCRGVKRAVDCAMQIDPHNTYIYGEIIHNKDVVEEISKRGIQTVEDLSLVPDGSRLIIRSHGVSPSVYEECERRNIEVVDCTCAFVRHTQNIVKEHYEAGEGIVIIGEKRHPEVVGINGWCKDTAVIFSSEEDDFSVLPDKKCCLVVQTTFSKEKFEKIIKIINDKRIKTVEVFKTICYTTIGRQIEAEEIARKCDAVLVIGGLNSSNTNKLYEVCAKHCKWVFRMRNADDLDYKKIEKFKKVGIVTGASTPNAQTQEVLLKMVANEQNELTMQAVVDGMDEQPKFKKGQLITATVSAASENGVAVLFGTAKKEIEVPKEELDCEVYDKNAFNVGDEIELMVVALNPVKFSQKLIKQIKEEEAKLEEIKSGKEFEVVCSGFNKGGLTAQLGSYTVFVPAREIRSGYVKELDKYVGKKLRLRLIELKAERRKEIIATQRAIIEEEKAAREALKAAKEAEFFANIHVDDVVEGRVDRITAFGAFVSVNGFDCLAHISDLSWTGVKKVEDVLTIGQKYDFKVLKVDEEKKKVSIGYKQLQPEPWVLASEKYAEGDVIHGKVVRIVPFGAFVEVEKGIDGLVHISQITHEYLENPTTVLSIGQEIDAKILKLDPNEKKMTLSIKALEPKPENLERKPKKEKEEGEEKEKVRKPRKEKPADEMTEWNDVEDVSVSIADLLNSNS